MARTSASSRPLTDHEEIRQWAEERGAKPTCVRGTGGGNDVGMIRLDFPGYTGDDKLEEISWDEWFDKFDESGLALLVQDRTARGQRSNFNKLVSRETAGVSEGNGSSRGSRSESRRRGSSRDEEGYEASSGYSEDQIEGSDEELEEELEEDIDVEESRPVRVSGAGASRNRKHQARTTGREGSRSARSSATARRSGSQAGRSRNERSTKARTSTSKRGQATAGSRSSGSRSSSSRSRSSRSASSRPGNSRSSAKKTPARVRTTGSATARGRGSSSRKRAA